MTIFISYNPKINCTIYHGIQKLHFQLNKLDLFHIGILEIDYYKLGMMLLGCYHKVNNLRT